MEDKLIKIEGENRITFDIVVQSVGFLFNTNDSIKLTKEELLKKVMRALKTNGVIFSIYKMIKQLDEEAKE